MTILILKAELATDPLVRGYAAMTDIQAANDLNTNMRTVTKVATVSEVRQYLLTQLSGTGLTQRAVWDMLIEFGNLGTVRGIPPAGVTAIDARRSGARAIMKFLETGNADEGFLVKNTNIRNQFIALGNDGGNGPSIFTSQQLLDIEALAEQQVSRGQELGLGIVTIQNVTDARAA
jgi:hypothetical protein